MPLEQDKSGGFKLRLDDAVASGVYPNLFGRRVPLWEAAENVTFSEVGVKRIKGRVLTTDTLAGEPIKGVVQTDRGGIPAIFFGDLTGLWRHFFTQNGCDNVSGPSAPYNTVDGDADTFGNMWSFAVFGSWVFATNNVDPVQVIKLNIAFEDVTGMDITRAKILHTFGPHVMAFNTDKSSSEFVWCDADNPDVWVAAADNLAGQLDIREMTSGIQAVVPLGSRLAVYGNEQMFLVSYLANDLVFGYQSALNGVGAMSQNSVVAVGRRHFGLSQQGFFVTDGQSFEYIDDPAMRVWWKENKHLFNASIKVTGYHLEEQTQVVWYMPELNTTSNTIGVSYNYEKGTWSFLTTPYSATGERTTWRRPLHGDETGKIWEEDAIPDDQVEGEVTTAIPYLLRTKALDLDNADTIKELTSLRLGMTGGGLYFRIGWSETEDGTINWEATQGPFSETDGFEFIPQRTAGRYLHIEFAATELGADWHLQSMDVIGRVEGTR
jgi:hypothetical protein